MKPLVKILCVLLIGAALLVLLSLLVVWKINWVLSWGVPRERRQIFPDLDVEFPNHTKLKAAWTSIRDEALCVLQHQQLQPAGSVSPGVFAQVSDESWTVFMLFFYGRDYEDHMQLCPLTSRLLKSLPEVKFAMFSVLRGDSWIRPHHGPFNGCLRYHLALQVPHDRDKCFITCAGKRYTWSAGEDVLFDETFSHEVRNETADIRIVLFCDVQRDISGAAGWINRQIIQSSLPHRFFFSNQKNETVSRLNLDKTSRNKTSMNQTSIVK
jgi:aspartyl/asparaginyl beta-hydroxylase (cupin superfamily)